jgi:hypothetical protein
LVGKDGIEKGKNSYEKGRFPQNHAIIQPLNN